MPDLFTGPIPEACNYFYWRGALWGFVAGLFFYHLIIRRFRRNS